MADTNESRQSSGGDKGAGSHHWSSIQAQGAVFKETYPDHVQMVSNGSPELADLNKAEHGLAFRCRHLRSHALRCTPGLLQA